MIQMSIVAVLLVFAVVFLARHYGRTLRSGSACEGCDCAGCGRLRGEVPGEDHQIPGALEGSPGGCKASQGNEEGCSPVPCERNRP